MPSTIEKLKNIDFGTVTLLFALFLLVNATLFFNEASREYERVIIIYLLMTAYLFALPDIRSELFNIKFFEKLPRFALSSFIGFLVISVFGFVFLGKNLSNYMNTLNIGIILLQSFIVAVNEESLFRHYVELKLGKTLSNFVFALFHYTVYAGNVVKALFAFCLGMLLSFIKQWQNKNGQGKGLITIIGLHAGANIAQI